MKTTVDGHGLRDAVVVGVSGINLPARLHLNQGRKFGVSPYTLFVDMKIKAASGANLRVASSITEVPLAFTVKSVTGSRAT